MATARAPAAAVMATVALRAAPARRKLQRLPATPVVRTTASPAKSTVAGITEVGVSEQINTQTARTDGIFWQPLARAAVYSFEHIIFV